MNTLAAHPTRSLLATAGEEGDRRVKVWNLGSGRLIAAVTVPGTGPIGLAWSGDGRYLLATGTGQTLRWELADPPALFNEGKITDRVTYWPNAYLRRVG